MSNPFDYEMNRATNYERDGGRMREEPEDDDDLEESELEDGEDDEDEEGNVDAGAVGAVRRLNLCLRKMAVLRDLSIPNVEALRRCAEIDKEAL